MQKKIKLKTVLWNKIWINKKQFNVKLIELLSFINLSKKQGNNAPYKPGNPNLDIVRIMLYVIATVCFKPPLVFPIRKVR